tara:strand:+ start:3383 stop:4012 length:630 start_codon:yes stop_codon:yes gene_type:complete
MENNSKNIRPYKDLSSRKISASSSISLSSLLVPLILIVVVILSTVFISLNQNKLQKEIADVNLRLSTMEKNQADLGETSQITLESLEQNLKDANFEIRKLWDLSNKRNRRNIETTMKSLETLQEQADDIVKKSQLNEESLKRLALSLDKTRKLVARISGSDNSFDQLESKIVEIEEANESNMAFREQISEALIRIQADLSSLEIALEDK